MLSCLSNHYFLKLLYEYKVQIFHDFYPLFGARCRCNVGAICPIKSGTGTQKILFLFFFIITINKTILIVFISF